MKTTASRHGAGEGQKLIDIKGGLSGKYSSGGSRSSGDSWHIQKQRKAGGVWRGRLSKEYSA